METDGVIKVTVAAVMVMAVAVMAAVATEAAAATEVSLALNFKISNPLSAIYRRLPIRPETWLSIRPDSWLPITNRLLGATL